MTTAATTFHSTKLPNGLTVIGERNESALSTALGFFVRTGARDETAKISGVSHFLEHMMFKGTPKRSALDISFDFGAIGAQSNAYTSEENTVYYTAVLPEYFGEAFDVLSDMLRPSLDGGEFATEKKVILEEIALYQDRPHYVLFESALREYFGKHPAGNSVLGSIQTISDLSVDEMREYFERRYAPNNMVLAAAGNFSWDALLREAARATSGWTQKDAGRVVAPHSPVPSTKVITKEDLQMAHAILLSPGPSAIHPQRYAAHILACILGDHTGSKAFWKLVDPGIAESASVDIDEMDGTGAVMSYVSGEPHRLDEIVETLQGILAQPTDFDDGELSRAKTKTATRLMLSGESSMRRLMSIGNDWIYRGEYMSLEDELQQITKIQRSDILEMLEEFSFSPTTVVKLIPA